MTRTNTPKTCLPPDGKQPALPITYTFDNRAFVVEPVFKETAACTVSDILLRLMRADLETS